MNTSLEIFYHDTKAILNQGDLIEPGFNSNYGSRKKASYVYLTATLDAAICVRPCLSKSTVHFVILRQAQFDKK